MSKLIDLLSRKNQSPAPFGFRTARAETSVNRLVLLAAVTAGTEALSKDPVREAHAVLLRAAEGRLTAKAIQAAAKALEGTTWGIADNAEKPINPPSGCDFVLMTASARPAAAPKEEAVGRLLEVESSMDDSLLRAINDLPVDAVVIADSFTTAGDLNWHQLMIFRHLTRILSVPVIVPVPSGVTEEDLKVLWDAGIDGVLADATGSTISDLKAFIDKLPARSESRKKHSPAIVPRITAAAEPAQPAPEPDEEEEEEDCR